MKIILLCTTAMVVLMLHGCASSNKDENASSTNYADSSNSTSTAGNSADKLRAPNDLKNRQYLRTIDFKCEVNNALTAISKIEQGIQQAGGIVLKSEYQTTPGATKIMAYKPDSVRKITTCETTVTLTARLPVACFDSFIARLPAMVDIIESRNLQQEDVTYNYKVNQLLSRADSTTVATSLQNMATSKPINREVMVNEVCRQEALDKVKYATITIAMTQPVQTVVRVVPNPDFRPSEPFFSAVGRSLLAGLDVLANIFTALLSIWPLILVGISGFAIYRNYRKRKSTITT